ncbi:MAG: S1C family serine protease [Nitrospiraceae bacterium]
MMTVRTTMIRSPLFYFVTIPFLLASAWPLETLIASAEPMVGSAPSHEKSLSVPAVVAKVRPSAVTILTRGVPATPSQAQSGSGSGLIIDAGGYILTNNHLVAGIKSLVVGLSTGRLTPGRVVARDFLLDLALVKITATDLVPATLSPSSSLEIGESVVAIGNPLALKGGSTVTVGVVSAVDRSVLTPDGETLYDLIQTDAAINPGNSGGPLVDLSGHVIGINVAIAPSAQAISYAISMEAIYPHIQSMIAHGSVLRPDIGFTPVTITASIMASFELEGDRGVLALNVKPTGPAAVGGLHNEDIITAVEQHQIYNLGDFWHTLRKSGDQPVVQLTIQRKNVQSTISIQKPALLKSVP